MEMEYRIKQLRVPCGQIKLSKGLEIGRHLLSFLDKWNKSHPNNQGVGLAANQVGILSCVCIVQGGILVNPVILERSYETVETEERCLSLPASKVMVTRNLCVKVQTDNLGVKLFGLDLSMTTTKPYGKAVLEAVCVQHEIDHLQGKLIIDYKTKAVPDVVNYQQYPGVYTHQAPTR